MPLGRELRGQVAAHERDAEVRRRWHEELAWGAADALTPVFCVLAAPLAVVLWLVYGRRLPSARC